MIKEIIIKTNKKEEIIDVTREITKVVKESGIKEGLCTIYVKHATAAIIINENYDPNLRQDILDCLNKLIPQGIWRHDKIDDNAAAHIKASILGPSETIIIKDNNLELGTWQSPALVELDGPRERIVLVEIIKEAVK